MPEVKVGIPSVIEAALLPPLELKLGARTRAPDLAAQANGEMSRTGRLRIVRWRCIEGLAGESTEAQQECKDRARGERRGSVRRLRR